MKSEEMYCFHGTKTFIHHRNMFRNYVFNNPKNMTIPGRQIAARASKRPRRRDERRAQACWRFVGKSWRRLANCAQTSMCPSEVVAAGDADWWMRAHLKQEFASFIIKAFENTSMKITFKMFKKPAVIASSPFPSSTKTPRPVRSSSSDGSHSRIVPGIRLFSVNDGLTSSARWSSKQHIWVKKTAKNLKKKFRY